MTRPPYSSGFREPRRSLRKFADDLLSAIDYCYEQGWIDGLSVVAREFEPSAQSIRNWVGQLAREFEPSASRSVTARDRVADMTA